MIVIHFIAKNVVFFVLLFEKIIKVGKKTNGDMYLVVSFIIIFAHSSLIADND